MATFDPIFAADPDNPELIAQDASITIFNPDDSTMTPVTITDPTGSPLANPVLVNDKGWGPAFKTPTGPGELFRVGWSGAGFTGFFTSYEGMRDATLAAKASAESAAYNAAGAATEALAGSTAAATAAATSASTAATSAAGAATTAANALAAAQAAQSAAEAAAATAPGGGVAVNPADPDSFIITTRSDGSVAVAPSDSDAYTLTF